MQSYTCPICREPIINQTEDIEAYKHLARLNQVHMMEDDIVEANIIDESPQLSEQDVSNNV
jgi:hypothetical protein